MKNNKITEQIHVLGATFKDIYEIADYSCKEMPKDGVYVGPCSASWRQTIPIPNRISISERPV